jgi:TRAP-type C4-dicarboxylate transport system permease small subunit
MTDWTAGPLDTLMAAARRFTQWGVWFGGALVLLAAVLIGIDVLMRKFLAASIGGADELAGYALAVGTAWGLGSALVERAHIRIDSLYLWFPRPLRLALDAVGLVLFIGFFGLVAWHGWGVVEQSWTSGSRSQSALETPTIIPQALWLAGLVGLVVVGIIVLLHGLALAARGDPHGASTVIGTRSAEEEVEDEIRDLKERGDRERAG